MGYEMSFDFHERTRLMAIAQFCGQWAWVIAPWFWVIIYDPELFESAESATRELSVYVAIVCTVIAIIPALLVKTCLLYTSPSPRDATLSRMPSSA